MAPDVKDPNGAAAVQELLGGRFGEMSTINTYLQQSFAFKEKAETPFDLPTNVELRFRSFIRLHKLPRQLID